MPLQEWVKDKGLRVIVMFEGRDGAGKGGTIRAITERVSPRVFRRRRAAGPVGPRKEPDVHAAVHAAFPGRRRDRDLRPQLVQPRRGRARDGLLHRRSSTSASSNSARRSRSTSSTAASSSSSTGWKYATRSRSGVSRRASTTRCGSGSSARWTCRRASAGTSTRAPATDARRHGHQARAVAHPALRRQEAGPAQLHRPFAEPDSLRKTAAGRSQAARSARRRTPTTTRRRLKGRTFRRREVLRLEVLEQRRPIMKLSCVFVGGPGACRVGSDPCGRPGTVRG